MYIIYCKGSRKDLGGVKDQYRQDSSAQLLIAHYSTPWHNVLLLGLSLMEK
jgi:hypothetical protein